jgi:hypothetical protein
MLNIDGERPPVVVKPKVPSPPNAVLMIVIPDSCVLVNVQAQSSPSFGVIVTLAVPGVAVPEFGFVATQAITGLGPQPPGIGVSVIVKAVVKAVSVVIPIPVKDLHGSFIVPVRGHEVISSSTSEKPDNGAGPAVNEKVVGPAGFACFMIVIEAGNVTAPAESERSWFPPPPSRSTNRV